MSAGIRRGSASRSPIADLLDARCEEIARRFVDRAQDTGAALALRREDIIDSLREYLVALARRLRAEHESGQTEIGKNEIAAVHGEQRFLLGYDVGALVREYGALRDLIWDVVLESGIEVSLTEIRRLFTHVSNDVADAAVEYGVARDHEVRKQTSKHLAFLAHELRNPVASARMALSLMRVRDDVRPSRALDALERSMSRVGQLIDDSLVSAKLKDLSDLECVDLDLGPFLRELVRESDIDADAKGVALRVDGDGRVNADVRALRSAVSNLVRNAVKFSHTGGVVQVRARRTAGRVLIEVEDSCGGLPAGTTMKLFDPFVQLGSDKTGFGLGLAIAKQAVDAHGGQLRVHDIPGKGCVFVLDLPEHGAPGRVGA